MGKFKHVCNFCGKEFENYFENSKYCSKECYNAYKSKNSKLKNRVCKYCGKLFDAHDSNTIYCSRECAGKAQRKRIVVTCDNCGKEYEIKEYELNGSKHHFCSYECKRAYMFWSEEDENILIDNYGKMSYSDISKLISRDISPHSIYRKVKDLGIACDKNTWSQHEIDILVMNYSIKPMSDIMALLPGRTQSAILGQARKQNLKSYFYLNRIWSDDDTEYLKDNYINKSYDDMSKHLGRSVLAIKQRMYLLDLHKPLEIVGYGDLYNYVRCRLATWKKHVREASGYTCAITGVHSNIIVHHIRSFNLLLDECIEIMNFPVYDDFSLYTQNQLDEFMNSFMDLQEYYGLYICISEKVHNDFHRTYGFGDNTLEQWNEFVSNYTISTK